MNIRASTEQDKQDIFQLHRDTFAEEEAEAVAKLALELLEDETALPLLSLVAEQDGDIVGHILFSSVSVEGADKHQGYILAPLAVLSNQQGRGIGSALIRRGLDILKTRRGEFVLVLGDPKYYSRTGFAAGHGISPPYELAYPQAWMALELKKDALKNIKGKVQCAASLSPAQYW
ncbi:GNAT family N-acetyltransferase [Thalassomonas actiniarum]|uniref:N-acetyltransferase n=1 Tax=Thalassomonas actiniarum TaxID=485447 RepID=A0AAE9YWK7_9GAMM|nr:N-acetyltransferase [Thalassomonas actiniarum]WDE02621.1 N-acetyltransferase [Thalassomonas actiniarum]